MKCYLINLNSDKKRLERIKPNLNRLGLEFERIEAVNGHELSQNQLQSFMNNSPRDGRGWRPGQVGCFMSHYKIWQRIAQGAEDFALVLEDDLILSNEVKRLNQVSSLDLRDIDILRLDNPTCSVLIDKEDSATIAGLNVFRLKSESWCTGAYILTKESARELISVRKKDWEPTDFFLYSPVHSTTFRRMKIYQAYPFLINQTKFTGNNEFGSNIETSKNDLKSFLSPLRNRVAHYIPKLLLGYKRVPSFKVEK